ncbi:DUF1456 family protein [Haliovirga abyssi]|uniref:DUF1456 family protein n=1 Tax=Haliovirga abyssi TaxID=2996794 RepID=A0AAU9E4E4_9FUSO|nr:DUF1456 family protein [Haliovirga abyssi]BDU51375.1 hypothetical protein HLVA_19440 [Haliovirga abyssi]
MTNNDILRRVRYALDIPDKVLIGCFKEFGEHMEVADVRNLLKKENEEGYVKCSNKQLGMVLDGYIIYKRGRQEPKPGEEPKPRIELTGNNFNNLIMKKLKIALNLRSDDIIDIFNLAGVNVSVSELRSLFRKPGHKNYKECLDSYLRNFLKGLTIHYRGE